MNWIKGRLYRRSGIEDLTGDEQIRDYELIIIHHNRKLYACYYCGWLNDSAHIVYKVRIIDDITLNKTKCMINLTNEYYCMGTIYDFMLYVLHSDIIL